LVTELTKLPKEIVNIIKDWTLVSPSQQLIEKRYEPQLFSRSCYTHPYIDGNDQIIYSRMDRDCKHEMIGQYKLNNHHFLSIDLPTPVCKKNNQYIGPWEGEKFSTSYCGKCFSPTIYYKDLSTKIDDDTWAHGLCINCDKIRHCLLAEKDDQICAINLECVLCEKLVCSHAVHKRIFNTQTYGESETFGASKKLEKILCTFCKQTFTTKLSPSETRESLIKSCAG
jgi:hypothetical protein